MNQPIDWLSIAVLIILSTSVLSTAFGLYFVYQVAQKVTKRYDLIFEDLQKENFAPMKVIHRSWGLPPYLEITVGDIRLKVDTQQYIRLIGRFPRKNKLHLYIYPNMPLFIFFGMKRVLLQNELNKLYRIGSNRPDAIQQRMSEQLKNTLIEGKDYLAHLMIDAKKIQIGFKIVQDQMFKEKIGPQVFKPDQAIPEEKIKTSIRWSVQLVREIRELLEY